MLGEFLSYRKGTLYTPNKYHFVFGSVISQEEKKIGFRMQTPLCRVTVQYTVQNGTPSKRGLFRRNHRSKLELLGKTKTQG